MLRREASDESELLSIAAEWSRSWGPGTVVYLSGPLGAGKTMFVRGVLRALGWTEPVRSPTFNLMQEFPTDPPVLHTDLYRLREAATLGLEDYLETHLLLVEWPDRLGGWLPPDQVWHVEIAFSDPGRTLTLTPAR